MDHKTDITIEVLEELQAKNDPEEMHKFFLNSIEWRPAYRDFYNSEPWSWVWYKDKQLIEAADAETIDMVLYIKHDNYKGAIAYIIRDEIEIKKIKSAILLCAKLIKEEVNENILLSIYFNDQVCIKTAEQQKRYAVIVINRSDYENGYDLK